MKSCIPLKIWQSLKLSTRKTDRGTERIRYLGRQSNNLSVGIVGLANVGKSTLFQSITNSQLGNPANYPYATIDKEEAKASLISSELLHLSKLYGSQKIVPSSLNIVDIAGLTRNAAKGEGLGNKFLADIRTVDGIFSVVRAFRDDSIIHIEANKVDPVRDLSIVLDELLLKDIEFVETAVEKLRRDLKKPHIDVRNVEKELGILSRIEEVLYEGRKVSEGNWSIEDIPVINSYNFLTAKPTVHLVNVSEEDFSSQSNEFFPEIKQWVTDNCPSDQILLFSAQYEKKLRDSEDLPESLQENLGEHAQNISAIPRMIDTMRSSLHLISFYTCGEMEARQWTIRSGSTAPEAAGTIHTDLEKSFIHAQVYKYTDLQNIPVPIDHAQLKKNGKQLRCGKNYIVENNDVLVIKSTKGKVR